MFKRGANKEARSRLETVVNIGLVVVALVFAGSAVRWLYAKSNIVKREPVKVGSKFNLPGVDWAQSERTVVLALSNECRFCSESAPLYQRLGRTRADGRQTRIIAVLPQPVDESRRYLDDLGVFVDGVYQSDMVSLGVPAAPTLLIVDGSGTVTDVWIGTLTATQERALFGVLNIPHTDELTVDAATLKGRLAADRRVRVVNVDGREVFEKAHIPGAVNIPLDELETRAEDELADAESVVVYCRCADDALSEQAADMLLKNGFKRVTFLRGGYEEWKKLGAPEARSEAGE